MDEVSPELEQMVRDVVVGMSAHERIKASVQMLLLEGRLRQVDAATALGLERTVFGNRMRGRSRWTSQDLDALALYFGVDVADLLGGVLIKGAGSTGITRINALTAARPAIAARAEAVRLPETPSRSASWTTGS